MFPSKIVTVINKISHFDEQCTTCVHIHFNGHSLIMSTAVLGVSLFPTW